MGHAPPRGRLPTRLEAATDAYMRDDDLEAFEAKVADLLARGVADERCPPMPPPIRELVGGLPPVPFATERTLT